MCLHTFTEHSVIFKTIYTHTKCLIGVANMRSCEKQEIQLGNVNELASDALSVHKVSLFMNEVCVTQSRSMETQTG